MKINGMRPQDIPVLLQLHLMKGNDWLYADIATLLHISPSEVSESLERSRIAGLLDNSKRKIMPAAMYEFLVYGIKYVWPAVLSKKQRGVPTAHSAKPLSDIIVSNEDVYVWAYAKGNQRGESIQALYPTIPEVVENNPQLYELLALIDALRIGKAREVQIARDELNKRLIKP
jgi:hypothetical protein